MPLMIDISHVGQGFLPLSFFQAAVAAGVTDICVKAGGADDGLYKDAAHDQHVAFARQVGCTVHHYFFNGPAATPAQCADAFYEYANPQPGDRMWWDIEPETGMAAWNATQIAAADAQLSSESRTLPGDYLNESEVLSGQWNTRSGDSLWEAAYITGTPSPGAWGAYQWWQYTDALNIAGVNVDASRLGTGPTTNMVGGSTTATDGEDDMAFHVLRQANGTTFVLQKDLITYDPAVADQNVGNYLRGGQKPFGLSESDLLVALYRAAGISQTLAPWPTGDQTATNILDSVLPGPAAQFTRQVFDSTGTPSLIKYN